jgi:hypothetical protein
MSKSHTRHLDSTVKTSEKGYRYRLLEGFPVITVNDEGSSAREEYLMRSEDALKFNAESFPPPIVRDGFGFFPTRRRMPGTGFITKSIEFRPHKDDLPWDPAGIYNDSDKEGSGFDPYCIASIEYGTEIEGGDPDVDRDPTDPVTFLEKTMTAGGQWLSLPPQKTLVEDGDVDGKLCANNITIITVNGKPSRQITPAGGTAEAGVPSKETIDNAGGSAANTVPTFMDDGNGEQICIDAQGQPSRDLTACQAEEAKTAEVTDSLEDNRDYELPVLWPIHTVEYGLKWNLVLNPQFGRWIHALGKVNSDRHQLFWNAKRETVLFTGIVASQKFIWNSRRGTTPTSASWGPWTIEFRFSQRVVEECGRTYGWNHVFSPEKGRWVRVFRANGMPLHTSMSIKNFFS